MPMPTGAWQRSSRCLQQRRRNNRKASLWFGSRCDCSTGVSPFDTTGILPVDEHASDNEQRWKLGILPVDDRSAPTVGTSQSSKRSEGTPLTYFQQRAGCPLSPQARRPCYDRANAIRKNVARIRKLATNVPRNVPETFDPPPVRQRWLTGISRTRKRDRAAFICISRFQPYVFSRIASFSSASRRIARNGDMSV